MKKIFTLRYLSLFIFSATIIYSCSKGGSGTPPDPCAGITVAVTGTVTNPTTIGGSNGSIVVSASGGSGFTYNINGGAFQSATTFTGLAAGSYTVIAKNSSGCTGTSTFTVSNPPNPCSGVTVVVTGTSTNPTTAGGTNGSITASATGSTGFTFSINGGAFQASGNFTGLGAGAYTITAKDLNGCLGSANFTLTAPNPCSGVVITVTGTVTNPTTVGGNNGSIVASATGSTGFTYNINGGAFQASGTFNGLTAGAYTITAKDLNGCLGSANFTLTDPNPCAGVTITVNNSVVANTPCMPSNGMITATASGGTGTFTYSLNGITFQASNVFSNLAPGSYTVSAKDGNNCVGTSIPALVSNLPEGPLFSQVKAVLQTNCVPCHNNSQQEGGMNWTIDCNIVTFKDRIKARAVDASPSAMPPTGLLPLSERQKIVNWINAGGKFTD